jgi:hypothetical protein
VPQPLPTLNPEKSCIAENHESDGLPICCTQLDLFIGFQSAGNTIEDQKTFVTNILDGFVKSERHLSGIVKI